MKILALSPRTVAFAMDISRNTSLTVLPNVVTFLFMEDVVETQTTSGPKRNAWTLVEVNFQWNCRRLHAK